MDPKEFVLPTLASVQRFFGISSATSKEWRRQGMPVDGRGRYNLRDIFHWWLESGKADRWAAKRSKNVSLDDEKLAIDIEIKRLKLQREAGELVERLAAYACLEQMFHRVRTRLEAIPEEIGSSFPPETRATVIDDVKSKIRLILREMEHWALEEES